MRKVRDFDTELKALNDRAKLLRSRKVQQFGELIEATGADVLEPDLLAGGLLAIVAEKNMRITGEWSEAGAAFFRATARRTSRRALSRSEDGKAAEGRTQPT